MELSPGVLTNQKITADCKVLLEPDEWKNGIISRNQIAHYLIKQADSHEHIMKIPVLINLITFSCFRLTIPSISLLHAPIKKRYIQD